MRAVIHHIVRKSRGGQTIREVTAEGELLIGGRGNDCGLHLPDPRVLLHHVEFAARGGAIYVSTLSGGDLRISGNLTEGGKVAPGQLLRVGPYELTVEPWRPDADLVLAVELVQPLADDLDQLVAGAEIAIPRIGLSVRAWSWIAALMIALGVLFIPLALNLFAAPGVGARVLDPSTKRPQGAATLAWSSGPISAAHKFFGDSCTTCHTRPFAKVADSACTACHTAVEHHTDMLTAASVFTRTNCQDCHKEHRGVSVALDDQNFCASCHGRIETKVPKAGLRNVSDFAVDHPEFRPSVIVDTAALRVTRNASLADMPAPQQRIGLKFPHDKHLMTEGVRDGSGAMTHLACADCHRPDAGGVEMRPINFERDCHSCHQLKFDAFVPDRELMHVDPKDVARQVRDIYDALALHGGYDEPTAPQIVRRRPGTPLTAEEKKVVGDWAEAKSADVLQGRFGKGLCAECHDLVDAPGDVGWSVAPVVLVASFFPKAHFTHAKHISTDCRFCHAAEASDSATEVLMPSIKVCRSCHGQEAAGDRVPSTCIECHSFHRKEVPVVRETVAPSPVSSKISPRASLTP